MSDLLENKTDSEIEEIYNKATMEDLQNMVNFIAGFFQIK